MVAATDVPGSHFIGGGLGVEPMRALPDLDIIELRAIFNIPSALVTVSESAAASISAAAPM